MNLHMGPNFYDDMAVMPAFPRSELLAGHPSLQPQPMHRPPPHAHGAVTGTSASLDPRPLTTAALIDPPMPPLPPVPLHPPPPPRDPPGQPGLTAALRERLGLPGLLAAGRRLPKPPLAGQRAMNIPSFPQRPLPHTQKPERLTTRNRRLPKIPNPLSGAEFKSAGAAGAAASAAAANANNLTTSLFGFARRLTGTPLGHHHPPEEPFGGPPPPGLKSSRSISGGLSAAAGRAPLPAQGRPPGRGAKLPSVPKIGAPHRRRQLPDRGALYSRSLEGPHLKCIYTHYDPSGTIPKLLGHVACMLD